MSKFSTDAIRPSALPSASLGRRGLPSTASGSSMNSEKEVLEKEYQTWNTRIDAEVKSLSSGLKELVQLANIKSDPPAHTSTKTPLDLQIRTSQIIRSTQNLRDIAHDLKLALLLSNQVELVTKRDEEVRVVREEVGVRRREVGQEVVRLLAGSSGDKGDSRKVAGAVAGATGGVEKDMEEEEEEEEEEDMEVVGQGDQGKVEGFDIESEKGVKVESNSQKEQAEETSDTQDGATQEGHNMGMDTVERDQQSNEEEAVLAQRDRPAEEGTVVDPKQNDESDNDEEEMDDVPIPPPGSSGRAEQPKAEEVALPTSSPADLSAESRPSAVTQSQDEDDEDDDDEDMEEVA